MGSLNAAPNFLAMMTKIQMEWDTLAKERGLKNVAKINVYDVLLYGRTAEQLLMYFITVLDFLKHPRATLKLKGFKWFQYRCKFLYMGMTEVGTHPAQSKNEAFCQARATKYIGRPPHAHWELRFLQPVFDSLLSGYQTL